MADVAEPVQSEVQIDEQQGDDGDAMENPKSPYPEHERASVTRDSNGFLTGHGEGVEILGALKAAYLRDTLLPPPNGNPEEYTIRVWDENAQDAFWISIDRTYGWCCLTKGITFTFMTNDGEVFYKIENTYDWLRYIHLKFIETDPEVDWNTAIQPTYRPKFFIMSPMGDYVFKIGMTYDHTPGCCCFDENPNNLCIRSRSSEDILSYMGSHWKHAAIDPIFERCRFKSTTFYGSQFPLKMGVADRALAIAILLCIKLERKEFYYDAEDMQYGGKEPIKSFTERFCWETCASCARRKRIKAERIEAERIEAERIEAERIEAERIEAERIEAEADVDT